MYTETVSGEEMTPFQDFITGQMNKRGLKSFRAFADFAKISRQTMNRIMRADNPSKPSRAVLVKIAEATDTDIRHLSELVDPQAVRDASFESKRLLALIERLPKREQDAIWRTVEAMLGEGADDDAQRKALT